METSAQHSSIILQWLLSAIAVLVTAKLVPGFKINGFVSACIAAAVIGLLNILVWPVLFFLTLPINILTFFLFTFVINGAILKMSAALLKGFEITSWWSAILGAVVLSLVNVLLHYVFGV